MLYVSKKTDYALIALAYLAERTGRVASAREIAQAHQIDVAFQIPGSGAPSRSGAGASIRGAARPSDRAFLLGHG